MRYLMIILVVAVMLAGYFGTPEGATLEGIALHTPGAGIAPAFVKFVPDMLSIAIVIYVVTAGIGQQFRFVNTKYWLVFGALAVIIASGCLANQEAPGPIINGMRYYFRAIPWFFLPAVYRFKDKEIAQFLKLVMGFALLQVPVAVWQRHKTAALGLWTGDAVVGTLLASGVLSLVLIGVLCVLAGMALKGRIGKLYAGFLFLLLVVPMSVNETKITAVLLPIALFATALVGAAPGNRLRVSLWALGLLVAAGAIFVPVMDYYYAVNVRGGGTKFSVEAFFSDPKVLQEYLEHKAPVGSTKEAGRVDALVVPIEELSKDPIKIAFGLGIGNASKSSIGPSFTGKYQRVYGIYSTETSFATFTLEIGILGVLLVLFLHWLLFLDAVVVARRDDSLIAPIAVGYAGVCVTVIAGGFYTLCHPSDAFSYLFWFSSGLIAARRQQLAIASSSRPREPIRHHRAAAATPLRIGGGVR
jgi:hypothetical protein